MTAELLKTALAQGVEPPRGRHLRIAWSDCYAHPLPEGHRFPMEKYDLVPGQLLYEGSVEPWQFFEPQPMHEELILRAHHADYWSRLRQGKLSRAEERRTGFPWSPELVHRERVIMQGTLDAARHALRQGASMNVSGGTHHAFTNRGEGFCLLNDIALAALEMLHTGELGQVLVIDLDVHQGNGTAEILRDEPRAFTFSMHCEANYPLHKEQSDWDLAVSAGTGDAEYLALLAPALERLFNELKPDLVFYLCGVDVLATDKLGHLGLSLEGSRRRDEMVLEWVRRRDLPVCMSMGGGYSQRIRDIVEAHCQTFRLAQRLFFD